MAEVPDIEQLVRSLLTQDSSLSYQSIQQQVREYIKRDLVGAERNALSQCIRGHRKERMLRDAIQQQQQLSSTPPKFTVCTAYSDNYTIGQLCSAINKEYCAVHGYEFVEDTQTYDEMLKRVAPKTFCGWYKIYQLLRLVESRLSEPCSNLVEYLVWIDADAVVINRSITLESLVREAEWKDLIIAKDSNASCLLNSGVMLLRVCEWSRELLLEVNQVQKYYHKHFFEQSAIEKVLKKRQEAPVDGMSSSSRVYIYESVRLNSPTLIVGGIGGIVVASNEAVLPSAKMVGAEPAEEQQEEEEEEVEEEGEGEGPSLRSGQMIQLQPTVFVYHPYGKRHKLRLLLGKCSSFGQL